MPDAATPAAVSTEAHDEHQGAAFDYARPADLFTRKNRSAYDLAGDRPAPDAEPVRSRSAYRNALTYRRFGSGAKALRYAVEQLLPAALEATVLVTDGDRHEAEAIRALYASADYPLRRRTTAKSR